ncbi:MAG: glycosyltransferase family 4 protein [Candidatus Eisenbacteria bacterium]|nr:glycosyltransferase family 4 protein [Candidatus Eisenbacteria bacterium]
MAMPSVSPPVASLAPTGHIRRPRVGIVGPYPPPYGGISVGIQRLGRHLAANGVDFHIYSETGADVPGERVTGFAGARRLLARLFSAGPSHILHYQSPDWRMRCLVALWGMVTGRKSLISIHGQSYDYSMRGGPLQRALIRFFLRRTSAVIACNPGIEARVRAEAGPAVMVRMIPAFLPPPLDEAGLPLPAELEAFLGAHSPVVLWVGWSRLLEGRDLYGLDHTLRLAGRLRKRFPGLGCVLWFSGVEDAAHWDRLWDEAGRADLRDSVFVGRGGLPEIHPLFRRADVYVRPTVSDGDSVSVREALALGTPVVASDAAPRPGACVTYRTGDADALERAVLGVLEDVGAARARVRREPVEDNGGKILDLYRELGL